jgi:hypothetical protein
LLRGGEGNGETAPGGGDSALLPDLSRFVDARSFIRRLLKPEQNLVSFVFP